MILQVLITFFLVFLNGFFVAAEFAIVKVRQSQIELLVRNGNRLAKLSKHIIEHMDAYLSATQLGITLASLGLGWIGEPVVGAIITNLMAFFGLELSPETAHSISLPIAFVTITVLHIVFGELAPKSLAIQRSEKVTLLVSIPLRMFYFIFSPFIWVLNSFANYILKISGFPPINEIDQIHSSDEIRFILDESRKSGMLEVSDHQLISNIFEFSDKDIKQIMVPRGKIVAVESSMELEEIVKTFIREGYTRLPIYDKEIDNIVGVFNAKDLLPLLLTKEDKNPTEFMRQVYFVQEDELLKSVLNKMLKNKVHITIVLDEFGGIAGMVTMEDIIEEIIGEIQDEYDDEQPLIKKLNEQEFVVSAFAVINELNDMLPVELPESEDYETIGGMVTSVAGRIPRQNEKIELDDYWCIILKSSERLIESVKLIAKKNRRTQVEND